MISTREETLLNTNRVLILLSTYNGDEYIREQLSSLLLQQDVDAHILVRDDGSTDSTLSILKEFAVLYPAKLSYWIDSNLGAKKSFFALILRANEYIEQYDYFSFCDQDDVWKENKLSSAIRLLQNEDPSKPLLYCSSTQMVDVELNKLSVWPSTPRKSLSTNNAAVENVVVGCTSIINQTALKLLASYPPTNYDRIIMHDWWTYLCISTFGKVIFDPEPKILYRQHGNNALGGQTDNWLNKWKKRFHRFINGQNHFIISNQAREFELSFHHKLDQKTHTELLDFMKSLSSPLFSRFLYTFRMPLYRQSSIDQFILKLLIILGKV
ncbi:Spore coat polysaccharide biosynthesis protein SpsA [compost metagenome]